MMRNFETQEIINLSKMELLVECARLAAKEFRLVQILALSTPEGAELTYSFSKEFHMVGLRCSVPKDDSIPSITPIWKGAFLYENEIKDLFGVRIENISVDYQGKFYDIAKEHPFAYTPKPAAPVPQKPVAAPSQTTVSAPDVNEGGLGQ